MRLAVFSDLHGNLAAFEAAWADYTARFGSSTGPDQHLWFLGDYAAFGPQPSACIGRIRALIEAADADETRKGTIRAIRGNTDRYLVGHARPSTVPPKDEADFGRFQLQRRGLHEALLWSAERLTYADHTWLAALPGETDLHVPGFGHVIGYHGVPGDDEANLFANTPDSTAADYLLDREGRIGVGGHIHRQFDRMLASGWRLLNVGSIGMSFDMPGRAQWAVLTFSEDGGTMQADVEMFATPYDVDSMIAEWRASGFPLIDVFEHRQRFGSPQPEP
jgi:predicted phosphodiesterase